MLKRWQKVSSLFLCGALMYGCSSEKDVIKMAEVPVVQSEFQAETVWSHTVGDGIGKYYSNLQPVIVGDVIFAASRDGDIAAFDKITGKEKWSVDLSEQPFFEEKRSARLSGGIAAAYGHLYIGSENGELLAISQDDGKLLWHTAVGGELLSTPAVDSVITSYSIHYTKLYDIGQVWRAAQVVGFSKETGKRPITNVVMMGMGEPLLNLANVVPAMDLMMDDFGFGLSKRRVTISTSGVVPALDKLGDMIDVALAISLHAPNDKLRSEIMPINDKYNIEEFLAGVRRYLAKSNANQGRVTVEYVLLDHVNDDMQHAHELAKVLKDTPSKINLIPFNPFPGNPYGKPSNSRIDRFSKVLMEYGFTVIVRKTRGDDIDAACGQLVGDVIDRTKRTMKKRMQEQEISVKML